ncbi:MAG TPA: outer membrane protein assembly factor BamA, partial [Oligoflexia bacterium]|nr:outer membrane protein assembly factor BamA [Oligoflexia bacterium]
LDGIESKEGDTFSVEKLRKDTFKVSDKFTDVGYAFTNVDPVTDINRTSKTVNVNYVVDKGNLIKINRIIISGNQKTSDNVIRRTLKVEERQLYSSSKIKRSQELLQRLGYFDEVTLTPEPALNANEVDLAVAVREGTTGQFSAGAGISSDEGFIISSQVSENNLFGTGNSVGLNVNLGNKRENFVLSYNNPRVNDSNWSFGTDLLKTKRDFSDYDREQMGGVITVGYPLWFLGPEVFDDVRFSLGYELMRIDITDVDKDAPQLVIDSRGESTASSVVPQIVRNTIDNPIDPKKGSRQMAKFEIAGLGGDEEFWMTNLTNTWYYPLWQSTIGTFVFSHRVNYGYGDTFNDEPFPLYKRFFPGGINSVRGYDYRELGPKDEDGDVYGGNKQLVTNFELIFPLFDSIGLSGVVFYDIGQAFDDDVPIEVSELRKAYGWGIRWRSPIAPIRLEIGYPVDREEGESASNINFSFGSPM